MVNIDDVDFRKEEYRIRRYNSILEGINRIFSSVVNSETEEELGEACLSVALEITSSKIGFVGEVGDDGLLHDIAISDMGWEQCTMYDKTGHRRPPGDFILHGLYGCAIDTGESFFTNNPRSHPNSIGLPQGHPEIIYFLGVPLIQEGETLGVIAVANREGSYSFEQQEDLEAIAPAVVQALQRKKAEEALKESEHGLAEAQRIAHLGNWEWDIETDRISWSDETYCIFGLIPQEFNATYDAFLSYIHPADRDFVDNAVKEALNGKPYTIDYRIILPTGEERIVHAHGEVTFNEDHIPVKIRGTVQDITERKYLEEQLRQRVEELELIMDVVPVAIFVGHDSQGQNITGNKKANEYAKAEVGENISATTIHTRHFFHNGRELVAEELPVQQAALKDIDVRDVEIDYLLPSGQRKVILGSASPLRDAEGHVRGSVGAFIDITDRKKAEESLKKVQETYIKEIHHRIKNNLQVISSLLDLQAEKFRDKKVLDAFKDSQNRVASMALIHEELYQGKGTDNLDFAVYLRKLTQDLFNSYNIRNEDISLILDLQEAYLGMDIAVPLGIIVNELVSNSLKHAFPNGKKWEIRISLKNAEEFDVNREGFQTDHFCREEGNFQYILTVADNGKGIPEEIDFQNTNFLGLQLINILVEQIDGCIELRKDQGTEFIIWFNNLEK